MRLQSLAMGSLRHAARTRMKGDKYNRRHGFAMLVESVEGCEAYDGATEEYLSYRVQKSDYASWSMRARFRQNERTEDRKLTSMLEIITSHGGAARC